MPASGADFELAPRGGVLGVIANPASGKDIRRLVAHADVTSNTAKRSMLVRALLGAAQASEGAGHPVPETARLEVRYLHDQANLAASAVEVSGLSGRAVDVGGRWNQAADTTAAARALRDAGAGAVLVLGGDGTCRAAVMGWPDIPIAALSTGTNNAFPVWIEPTVAGVACGLLVSGALSLSDVADRSKIVRLQIDGEGDDLALVDAVLLSGSIIGARALNDIGALRACVLAFADPTAMGMSGIGGLALPCDRDEDIGVAMRFAADPGHKLPGSESARAGHVRGPFAPGRYEPIPIDEARLLPLGRTVTWTGPGLIALDGERERVLRDGQTAVVWVERTGPFVIDVRHALRLAGERRLLWA